MRSGSCWPIAPEKDVDGFHPVQRRAGSPRAARAARVHAGRDYRDPEAQRASRCRASARWWWAAATSWVNRWRCCCCTKTRRSRFAIRRRPIWRPTCREADILVAAIGRPAMVTADYHSPRGGCDRRGHQPPDQVGKTWRASSAIRRKNWRRWKPAEACWWAMSTRSRWRSDRRPTRRFRAE